ncbi:hypothetical protein Lysil_2343 [Lysobacter silvestris]|uniref:Uncharacterized protein n=1 Tax=Solilutibacter silvestris TaxID=1645665 RepID=A0A2K1PZS7_9GAMM|nr:hypothetical protein Lysil_2343 [Lysobacter silvestris]
MTPDARALLPPARNAIENNASQTGAMPNRGRNRPHVHYSRPCSNRR